MVVTVGPPARPSPHPAATEAFGPLVSRAARQWRRAIDRELLPLGLSEATWLPLLNVARARAPLRQKDLAASLGLDNSSVVRLLDGLQAAGMVERREGEDRRARVIHITAAGQAVVDQVEAHIGAMRRHVLAGVADADLQAACRVLGHVLQRLATLGGEGGA